MSRTGNYLDSGRTHSPNLSAGQFTWQPKLALAWLGLVVFLHYVFSYLLDSRYFSLIKSIAARFLG